MVHDVIPADRAVVDYDIPSPQRYGIPLSKIEQNHASAQLRKR
jgi:hypothetical protein